MSKKNGPRRTCGMLLLLSTVLLSSGCAHLGMGEFGRAGGKELELLPEGLKLEWREVQAGIDYLHLEADGGRAAEHLLRIDLSSPELSIVVPPPIEEGVEPEQLWTGGETSEIPGTGTASPDSGTDWAVGGYLPILRAGENIGIHGARHALNLDGGDSSFLLLRGENGELVRYRGARNFLPCFMGVLRRGAGGKGADGAMK